MYRENVLLLVLVLRTPLMGWLATLTAGYVFAQRQSLPLGTCDRNAEWKHCMFLPSTADTSIIILTQHGPCG